VFDDRDLLTLSDEEMREVRGGQIGFVFQDAAAALNPVLTIGHQIAETLVVHGRATWRSARDEAIDLLAAVRIPDPAARAGDYPHQFSGGQRQRAMIAIALACRPSLLIADEPTTALDVTIQAEILDLLAALKAERDLAVLLITHDLGVVAQVADRVAVMYAGRIVEEAPVRSLFADARHPYTRGLLASVPGGEPGSRLHAIEGSVPAIDAVVEGCAFAPRCESRLDVCSRSVPAMTGIAAAHRVRCHLHTGATR
jgi:oligopeptide/dipeptide ABC transporter ATP-binding protein